VAAWLKPTLDVWIKDKQNFAIINC